ncbi:MAG: DUF192 domain-containing protein [Candidatus Micrarchaeota archaeon]|nr:DUF192 domain-containing protein [Candidatus Micrarchaeota archaeon]
MVKIKNYVIMRSFLEKIKGLMFERKIRKRLLFEFEKDEISPFHSFFCPNFEILFLDENMKVNEFYKIKEWKIIQPKSAYRFVLEAEPGFIRRYKIKVGKKIELE